jgi:CubicO group peptidase (beta-lactamase class C family)
MGTADLPHSTPSAEGVDPAGIEAFLDVIDRSPQLELHSLIVLRHGKVLAEGWWEPFAADRVHLLYSLSKSFTVTAAGFAVAEGLLDLDATVLSYFPEYEDEVTDPGSRAIRVRDVASMASGHVSETADRAHRKDPADLLRGFLLIPPDHAPGSVFAYNQPCTYSLAAIIQRRSGQTLVEYLRPRLFDPLGIGEVAWIEEPPGRNIGYSGLHATTDAVARLGQLYLQGGRWRERQLLPAEWVATATRKHIDTPNEPHPDWRQGYGFQFWRSRHGFRGDGAFGQFCLVLPEQDMVIATTAATEDMQGILDAVWGHVLPAVDRADAAAEGHARLAARLADAALPVVTAKLEPSDRAVWDDMAFASGPATAERGSDRPDPAVSQAQLRRSSDYWQLSLQDAGGRLDVRVGTGEWAVGESAGVPVAASGGWADDGTFVADVIFLDTPHRIKITCSAPDRVLRVEWPTRPLHLSSLLQLRKPAR